METQNAIIVLISRKRKNVRSYNEQFVLPYYATFSFLNTKHEIPNFKTGLSCNVEMDFIVLQFYPVPMLVCKFFQLFLFSGESHLANFNFSNGIETSRNFSINFSFFRKKCFFPNMGKSPNSWKKEVELIQFQTMGVGISFKELLLTVHYQCIYHCILYSFK